MNLKNRLFLNFLVRFTIFKTILNLVNLILIRQYLYKRGLKFEDFKYLFKNTKHLTKFVIPQINFDKKLMFFIILMHFYILMCQNSQYSN
jgi:hypothetical protein